jgi:hypothetical protein
VLGLTALNWVALTMAIDLSPLQIDRSAGDASPKAAAAVLREQRPGIETDYTETIARPLFNAKRRPSETPKESLAVPVAMTSPALLQAQLVGLSAAAARGKRALVRSTNDRDGTWLSIGEEFRGWRLRDIGYDTAIFENGDRRQELQLETTPGPREPTTP